MITEFADCAAPIIRLPITTLGETDAVLMEDWHINDVCGFRFTVPAGTSTDGASIPRFLWRLCGHPLQAPRVYAALLHDWLYGNGWQMGISRQEADEIYYRLLRHFGVSAWAAGIEYYALRCFGGTHYTKGKPKMRRERTETTETAETAGTAGRAGRRILLVLGMMGVMAGCKSIEVERHAQTLATVKNADGTVTVVRDAQNNPVTLDGGWEVDYFQHWNWQRFDSLSAKAGAGVSLDINNYASGADSNLVALVETSFEGGVKLCNAIGEAYAKIAGGKAQADTVLTAAQKVYEYFTGKGGDATKASVSTNTASNTLRVTDGSVCVECDAAGNCQECTP